VFYWWKSKVFIRLNY